MTIQQNKRSVGSIPRSQSDYGGISLLYSNKRTSISTFSIDRTSTDISKRHSSIPRPSSSQRLSTDTEISSSIQDEDFEFIAAANNSFPRRTSSIAPSSTMTTSRPSSRLPRPISSSTTSRDPVTPTTTRLDMYTTHKMRMSMTTNDLAALQEETTPRNEKETRRRSSIVNASPSKLPRRVGANATTPPQVGTGLSAKRYVSTPASLPSHKKENVVPIGLLRPVSPTQAHSQVHAHVQSLQPPTSAKSQFQHLQAQMAPSTYPLQQSADSKSSIPQRTIQKSRTVGILSSLRSSIQRSRSSLNFDQKSRNSSISSAATTSTKNRDSLDNTITVKGGNAQYIYGFHTTNFWAGRFSSVHDRLHNELLEASLGDEDSFQDYISNVGTFPSMTTKSSTSTPSTKPKTTTTIDSALYRDETPFEQLEKRRFTAPDEDARCKRVFEHLNLYCGDEGAKKSLFTFQLQFARMKGNAQFLPDGGKMEPLLERWGKKVEGAFGKRLSMRAN